MIAAVNGYAIGAGAQIAVSCDFMLMKTEAQIAFPEVSIGTFIGVFNLNQRLNLVGVADAAPGNIGIVSQSGNMMLALLSEGQRRGQVGFSTYVGVGNQIDVRFNEYLEYFGEDPDTAVPVFYVEGFKNGRRFLDVAREVTPRKPVVVYKSGRTEAGKRAPATSPEMLQRSRPVTVPVSSVFPSPSMAPRSWSWPL